MSSLKETLLSRLLLIGGGYFLIGYINHQSSPFAEKVLPVIYIFGIWPFVLMIAAGLIFGYLAHDKASSE